MGTSGRPGEDILHHAEQITGAVDQPRCCSAFRFQYQGTNRLLDRQGVVGEQVIQTEPTEETPLALLQGAIVICIFD